MGVYMKNLGCFLTTVVVSLELTQLQIHLNAGDYSLKFHVSKVPKVPYIAAGLITLNLRTFS